jgi:hypothetical protein
LAVGAVPVVGRLQVVELGEGVALRALHGVPEWVVVHALVVTQRLDGVYK